MTRWLLLTLVALAAFTSSPGRAEETQQHVIGGLSSTTLGGYVDTSSSWQIGPQADPVPEPSTLALLGGGCAVLVAVARRNRR